ncbi:MAG: DUF2971 domain-containing protein [Selenomonadaceae bacterium]|nr:DUF2971 domain-containing protein [Selenomonadaceae bacterium]
MTDFNDVFDNFPVYSLPRRDLFADIHGSQLVPSQYIERLQTTTHSSGIYERTRGVTCFAGSDNNQLMWAHYGDSSKGVCLGFDLQRSDNGVLEQAVFPKETGTKAYLLKVEYSDQRPVWQYSSMNEKSMAQQVLTRKSTLWAYEKETRVLLVGGKDDFPRLVTYHPSVLRSITFGYRTPIAMVAALIKFCRMRLHHAPLAMRYVILSPKSYEMNVYSLSDYEAEVLLANIDWLKQRLWVPEDTAIEAERNVLQLDDTEYRKMVKKLPAHFFFDFDGMFLQKSFPDVMQRKGFKSIDDCLKVAIIRNALVDMLRAQQA